MRAMTGQSGKALLNANSTLPLKGYDLLLAIRRGRGMLSPT